MTNLRMLLLYWGLLLSVVAFSQEKKAYVFFDKKGHKTTYGKLLRKSEKADVVLFGEYHNNPIAHWLQRTLIKDLQPKRSLILGAEMLERDNQEALDRYLQGAIDQKGLDTLARLWSNYKTDYKPLVNFAKKHQRPFVATNIPRRYANLVYKKGLQALDTLPAIERPWLVRLPFPYDGSLSRYVQMKKMARHDTENLPLAQAIKDATMAESILAHLKPATLFVHFNGSYHSDYFQGIYWYLKRERPDLRVLTIATTTQAELRRLDKQSRGRADFILVVDEEITPND